MNTGFNMVGVQSDLWHYDTDIQLWINCTTLWIWWPAVGLFREHLHRARWSLTSQRTLKRHSGSTVWPDSGPAPSPPHAHPPSHTCSPPGSSAPDHKGKKKEKERLSISEANLWPGITQNVQDKRNHYKHHLKIHWVSDDQAMNSTKQTETWANGI